MNDVANVESGKARVEAGIAIAVAFHFFKARQKSMSTQEIVQVAKENERAMAQIIGEDHVQRNFWSDSDWRCFVRVEVAIRLLVRAQIAILRGSSIRYRSI